MAKRGFTLIELLITIAVLATLMGIVFKLLGIGGDSQARAITISRMHRLENCLSGYNAAFGCYPPVALHASRDIFKKVNDYGIQDENGTSAGNGAELDWNQVNAACRAQPLACMFPPPKNAEGTVRNTLNLMQERIRNGFYEGKYGKSYVEGHKAVIEHGFKVPTPGMFSGGQRDYAKWGYRSQEGVMLFKYGLMSYLLPRYIVMLGVDEDFLLFAQWSENNRLPRRPFSNGAYNSWKEVQDYIGGSGTAKDRTEVFSISSQSVCARWMPNLKGICYNGGTYFGINTHEPDTGWVPDPDGMGVSVFTPNGGERSNQYLLETITVRDGWGRDFYYYSPTPYQKYTLWSAGADGKTFPPWIDLSALPNSSTKKTAGSWMADDIIQLSN